MAGNRDTAFLSFFHQEVHDQRSVNTVCYTGRPVPCIPDIPFIERDEHVVLALQPGLGCIDGGGDIVDETVHIDATWGDQGAAASGQYFAMKVLKKDEIVRRRQVSRTKVERLILERANFPFITRLYYAYQTPYRLYMVIDYMQCGDLFTHLSRFGVFTEDRARLYIAEIVLALEHLHNMGIIYVGLSRSLHHRGT